MSSQVRVFESMNICSHVLSFLSIGDNLRCRGTDRALTRTVDHHLPRLMNQKGKELLANVAQADMEEFESVFGKERISEAPVLYYPNVSKVAKKLPYGEIAVRKGGCRGASFHIGICKKESDGFLAVRVNYIAEGRFFGALAVKSEIIYHALVSPTGYQLDEMRDLLSGESVPAFSHMQGELEPNSIGPDALFRRHFFKMGDLKKKLA